jgi:hypothetical protein
MEVPVAQTLRGGDSHMGWHSFGLQSCHETGLAKVSTQPPAVGLVVGVYQWIGRAYQSSVATTET